MTHKPNRNYSLGIVAPFIAILTLLIAAAVLAQTPEAGRSSGKANAVFAPERPLTPWIEGAESFPAHRSQTKRHAARPLEEFPPLFLPAVTYNSGEYESPSSVVIADVNGDGKPDIVVTNPCASSCGFGGAVGVLLGNGDGTFQSALIYLTGVDESSVAAADVNGDGHPDLVVADASGVEILLGNGDGTFQPPVAYGLGGPGASVVVADVNRDGRPDLVVSVGGDVAVLLGNGDGTFQPAVGYGSGGSGTTSVAVGDVNRDTKPDLLVANWISDSVGVLLGNGDGTFQTAVPYGASGADSLAVADVNGDHNLDLVAGKGEGGDILSVLLGNGDGTFQPAVTYGSGGYDPVSIAVADVNGDGKLDLVVADFGGNGCCTPPSDVGVLLGNGDGTFQTAVTYTLSGWNSASVAVADVNGDGRPDLAVTMALDYSGLVGVMLHVGDIPTTTTVFSSINPSVFGQVITLTATVSSSSGTPTGTVEFFDSSTALGSATLGNGSASLSVSSLAAGSHSITAVYQGSLKFNSSASAQYSQVVNIAATTSSLASSKNPVPINKLVKYTATVTGQYGGTATGTVTFQDGGVTIATVTVVSNQAAYSTSYNIRGTHAITATYSGDANNAGSVSATLTEQVKGFSSKTVVTTSGSPSHVGQPVTFSATVTSAHGVIPNGELVTFYDGTTPIGTGATASGVASFTTSSLTAKTHRIKATYAGDATFEPSSGSVKQVVDKYPTVTALSSSLNPSNYGQAVTFTATVTSAGLTPTGKVKFMDGTATLGSVKMSGGVAKLTKSTLAVGTHPITAQYLGDVANDKSTSPVLNQVVQ